MIRDENSIKKKNMMRRRSLLIHPADGVVCVLEDADQFVMDCLANAMARYFADIPYQDFARDKTTPKYVLSEYFYNRIPEFETFDGDTGAFIQLLVEEYPRYA